MTDEKKNGEQPRNHSADQPAGCEQRYRFCGPSAARCTSCNSGNSKPVAAATMKEPYIADLAKYENQAITGFFAVASKQVRGKKDGSRYFALTLGDRTGQIEARMWETADAGEFVDRRHRQGSRTGVPI